MANYIPDELVEEIRLQNDIVDVVNEYVKLEKKGKDYFGICPFHKEKTPSFSVVPSKQIFYCFGCSKGGNVFHFIMNSENLDFNDAVHHLADRVKILIPESDDKEEAERARLRQDILKLNKDVAIFYHNVLMSSNGINAKTYLTDRGITERTIRHFGLGFSPFESDILYKHIKNSGYTENTIKQSGLFLPGKNNHCYDRFRNRIIFPIFDIRGKVIAFGGRVIDSSMPKYINSPDTPVYVKGKHLYALNFAKSSKDRRLVIVEGYMDVISLHQSGIINSVASLGTALTESQARLLIKYAEEVIISYDTDAAGQAATLRGLDIMNDTGCEIKVLSLPEGKDPDEYIKKNGQKSFIYLMDTAASLLEYKARLARKEINTEDTEGKIRLVGKMAELMSANVNKIEVEMRVKSLSKEFGVSEEAVFSEIRRRSHPEKEKRKEVFPAEVEGRKQIMQTRIDGLKVGRHEELMLLALLTINNDIENTAPTITTEDFKNETLKEIVRKAKDKVLLTGNITPAELMTLLPIEYVGEFAGIIDKELCSDDSKKCGNIIKLIRKNKTSRCLTELLDKNKNFKKQNDEEIIELNHELNTLLMKLKTLN